MRLVASAAWVAHAALTLVGAADAENALPARHEATETVTWRKCVNFMAGYAGSWFAKDTMFKDVKWPERGALEFATRDLFNHAKGKAGSGYKANRAVTDWMVVHLSGVEHRLVRAHGYEKGLALTNKTSAHALQMILRRHEVDAQTPPGPRTTELRRRSVAVVPFYGGVAAVSLDPHSGKVLNETLPAGAGNSHTLAAAPLKLLQLSAAVAAAQRVFGTAVVGVVSAAEATLVRRGLALHLPIALQRASVLRVQVVPCGAMSVHLPYRLLHWVQREHAAGGLRPPDANDTRADEGAAGAADAAPSPSSALPHKPEREPRRRRRLVARPSREVGSAGGAAAAEAGRLQRRLASTPQPRARRRASILGRKGPHHGHKGGGGSSQPDSAAAAAPAGGPRQRFDLVYYSEADNVLVERNLEATARALLGFAAAPDLGGRSYVAPNRLEGELHAYDPSATHAEVVKHLKPVGQNNCEDDRGDLEAFGPDNARTTTKGTPN